MSATYAVSPKSKWMDVVGGFIAIAVTSMMAFVTVAPYFGLHPIPDSDAAIVSQHQTTLQNVFIAIVSFFFGASIGTQKKDDTIQTLSDTASKAQDALTPTSTAVPLAPGEAVTVKADDTSKT